MKRFIAFSVVLALALSLLPYQQVLAKSAIQMHRQQVQDKDKNGWYPAKSTRGMFSVLLPLPFNDFSLSDDDSADVSHVEVVGCKSSEGIKFSATRIYYAHKGLAEKYFSKFRNGEAFPGAKPRLIRYKNHDVVEIRLGNSTSASVQRVVQVNGSNILLVAEWPKQYASLVKNIIGTFLDSLDVND